MHESVDIVAVAARTPVGLRAETTAAAIRAGISRIREHPSLMNAAGAALMCARDGLLPETLMGASRISEIAAATLGELRSKLSSRLMGRGAVPLFLALPAARPGFGDREVATVRRSLGAHDGAFELRTTAQGHAGALVALDSAMQQITSKNAELAVVGGVDSYLDADTLDWLEADRRLMRDDIRGGFPPGEGAAFIALVRSGRREPNLPSLARLCAVAHATESAPEYSDEQQGSALTDVYLRLGACLPLGARFDDVFIDINDERSKTTDYAFALLRCGQFFRDGSEYVTSVRSVGDLGAASAILHCILATCSFTRGYARGTHALVSSASWNGLRAGALLRRLGG